MELEPKPKRKYNRRKLVLTKEERAEVSKKKKQIIYVVDWAYDKIKKELLQKYGLKYFQELFDYLIVSGICYIKPEVVQVFRDNVEARKKMAIQERMSRFGRAERPKDFPKNKADKMLMYDRDFDALNKFVIEENTKKGWIIQILFEQFAKENPVLVKHVLRCKELKITERKKIVSRLLNDEYVVILPEEEAKMLLDRNTQNYDERKFDTIIQDEIDKLNELAHLKQQDLDEFERRAEEIAEMRRARSREVQKAVRPRLIDEDA